MMCHRRSKALSLFAALALTVVWSAPAPAQDDVATTKHNMSTSTLGLTNYGEVCVYCHTPHGGQTANAPLWNRSFGVGPYTMYNNAYSSTIDMTVDPAPTGVSLACLSCHDGTVGLDVIINKPNTDTTLVGTGITMPGNAGQRFANLSTDLRDDHPISIAYSTASDPMFNAIVSGKVGALPLYSGKVQCGSCHNPHTTLNAAFLRVSNSGSALCKTCHIK